MIIVQNVPDASLEEMSLYQNIKNSGITKATTRLQLFQCSQVIGWTLPLMNDYIVIISNVEGEAFSSLMPTYIAFPYKLPPAQVMMTNDW